MMKMCNNNGSRAEEREVEGEGKGGREPYRGKKVRGKGGA